MIVAVAVSAAPIILPRVAVNMAVSSSVFSNVLSFTTVTFTICTDSSGANVTAKFFRPVKSSESVEKSNSGKIATSLCQMEPAICIILNR